MSMRSTLLVALAAALGNTQGVVHAEDWPGFRGPGQNGIAVSTIPGEWGTDSNIAWKVPLAGIAWSQPVVWGESVFLTTAEIVGDKKLEQPVAGDWGPGVSGFSVLIGASNIPPADVSCRWQVVCLDLKSGEIKWRQTAHEGRPAIHIHRNNSYATETPVTDGERVIAHFGMTSLACYDMSGNLLWQKDPGMYPMQLGWGTGSSPLLRDGKLFIQCDNEKSSYIAALDAKTGDELWRVERAEKSNWSTPYLWKNKVRQELVTSGGGKSRSYDPATGDVLWEVQGNGRASCTPVGSEELVYVDSADRLTGRTGVMIAVRAGASGDVTLKPGEKSSDAVAWTAKVSGTRVASPLLWEDRLYFPEQIANIIHCVDAKTGEELYRNRVAGAGGFTASPWLSDGKAFFLDERGRTFVVQPGEKFDLLATNVLDDEMYWSSPAIAGDRLLIRSASQLYCIGK